jgi:hypothetical protein
MNKKYALLALVIALMAIIYAFLSEPPQPLAQTSQASLKVTTLPASVPLAIVAPQPSADKKFSLAMGANIKKVAMAYEQSIQYPHYSTPLAAENWDLLHPQQAIATQLPLAGDSDIQASLAMEDYVVFHGDAIEATLTVTSRGSLPDIQSVKVAILHGQTRLTGTQLLPSKKTANSIVYSLKITPSMGHGDSWPMALQLAATLELSDGGNTTLLASFKYSKKNVTLTGVKEAYVEDVDLIIPLKVTVHESGRYQFRANLFNDAGITISHLVVKENLSASNSNIAFKVHSSLLRAAGDAGPYVLKDFNITKVPSHPGDKTQYGFSQEKSYKVNGFALQDYSTQPYVNGANVQRLQFLKKLSY